MTSRVECETLNVEFWKGKEGIHYNLIVGPQAHGIPTCLLRVGRRDDGHEVEAVGDVPARVPHLAVEAEPGLLRPLEQDGLRPLPLQEHEEELLQQRAGRRRGVKLAHPG